MCFSDRKVCAYEHLFELHFRDKPTIPLFERRIMTIVVLRLQGLNTEAGSEDIRRFFHGLHIPEGGVHITGGEMGEAFIIFKTEGEAQQAMHRSGKLLRGSSISLYISSVAELKQKMESRLKKPITPAVETKTVPPAPVLTDTNAAIFLSLMAVIQGQLSNNKVNETPMSSAPDNLKQTVQQHSTEDKTNADFAQSVGATHSLASMEQQSSGGNINTCKPGYLRLYGFPDSVTEQDVRRFLQGFKVLGVITKVQLPLGLCCLVKLASFAEAEEGVKYNHRKYKKFNIEVRLAHEKMWTDATEQPSDCMHKMQSHTFTDQRQVNMDRNAFRGFSSKRSAEEQPPSGSSTKYCQSSPPNPELYVIVNNLSKNITKTEIRNILGCHEIPNYRIKHLLNKYGERTSTAFVTFERAEDYAAALNMNGTTIGLNNIEVSSITREEMFAILSRNRVAKIWRHQPYGKSMSCIYARNFPAEVKKSEVRNFFFRFKVFENQIILLVDSQGNGVGEAVVQFGCENVARQAQSLHGKVFMGTKILLTRITHQQMKEILGKQ
ncbi:RNA binding motif protein 12Ba [Misgurnus anguillicaudatus]|uniref:RNA binding motif protein 12Ba n=1 Tax=Misgurnus anguillicaudatus TaxID=75329 RepID=UPI003CCFC7CD